ncbi:hypothetical protein ACFE04_002283 [Oxalis oulophora]
MGVLDEGHFAEELEENGIKLENSSLVIEDAVKVILQRGLGEDIYREGIIKTPFRVAKAFREGTRGYKQKVKDIVQGALFPEAGLDNGVGHAGGVGGLVLVRDIDLFSYCESCLIPFQIKCHAGYVPSGHRVVGLSKLSRVAEVFARRLQDPQRLADEICSALHNGFRPAGVAILLQCSHIHFPNLESVFDSNHHGWVKSVVYSGAGVFENRDSDSWDDFLSLLKFRGINFDETKTSDSIAHCWCPSSGKISSNIGLTNPGLLSAVTSIIQSLGEDPSRKELIGTPSRFLKWMMNFQNSNLDMKLNGYSRGGTDILKLNGTNELVRSELNFSLWSQCEHHLLPFYGSVHIGHFRAEGLSSIEKSLLQSIVHFYGFKLQVQERLTRQIAETVCSLLGEDVMVVVEANHTCMISRGIEKFGSNTATIAVLGRFSTDSSARAMFLKSIPCTATTER